MASKPKRAKTSESQGRNVYAVDRILDRRLGQNGKEEFLIKWQGFGDQSSSWEPRQNLQCHELLEKFEKDHTRAVASNQTARRPPQPMRRPRHSTSRQNQSETDQSSADEDTADTYGLNGKVLRNIVGLTKINQSIHFLCRFTDESFQMIPSAVVNSRYPHHVIRYYESKIMDQENSN
ncbi:hypothetical protein CAEBREN_24061 [Caenorhabditis brenneri]|uniref:Chromo domain-containing protein n=1 Tax=Caenorhabditis brenneri TaxID=135651 RepID=G0MG71_CAEBE|nr:hypothetical protein CAEBREN_24061 [Caenorhabditis brenneri]